MFLPHGAAAGTVLSGDVWEPAKCGSFSFLYCLKDGWARGRETETGAETCAWTVAIECWARLWTSQLMCHFGDLTLESLEKKNGRGESMWFFFFFLTVKSNVSVLEINNSGRQRAGKGSWCPFKRSQVPCIWQIKAPDTLVPGIWSPLLAFKSTHILIHDSHLHIHTCNEKINL